MTAEEKKAKEMGYNLNANHWIEKELAQRAFGDWLECVVAHIEDDEIRKNVRMVTFVELLKLMSDVEIATTHIVGRGT